MSGRRSPSSFTLIQALIVAAIVLVSSFGVGLARLVWTDYNLRALEADEQIRVDALVQAIAELDKEIAIARTDDFVGDWARRVRKQTLAGEIPVVVVAPQAPPQPAAPRSGVAKTTSPAPDAAADGVPRWQLFLNRFFAASSP